MGAGTEPATSPRWPLCPIRLNEGSGQLKDVAMWSLLYLCILFHVCVCVCPPLSGSFPSPTKSGLDTRGVSRERRRAVLYLSAGREMDGGGKQVPATVVIAGCSYGTSWRDWIVFEPTLIIWISQERWQWIWITRPTQWQRWNRYKTVVWSVCHLMLIEKYIDRMLD